MTRSRTAKLQKTGGKELPAISLDDIKSVKLRSIGGVKVSLSETYILNTVYTHVFSIVVLRYIQL